MSNILVTVCGRGGSKGIPGKNIKEVGGIPLLAYTAYQAREFADRCGADVAVSTDSQDILNVAGRCGLPTDYVRPPELGNDVVGKPVVIRDLMLYCENKYNKTYDYVIDLDVTSPLRTPADIDACMRMALDNPEALTVFSVNPCGRNPYFNMVEAKDNGFYGLVKHSDSTTRQGSPKVYDINGSIYVYSRESLDCANPRAVTSRTLVYVMDHLCFDLDEPDDYDYLAYLIETGRIDWVFHGLRDKMLADFNKKQ